MLRYGSSRRKRLCELPVSDFQACAHFYCGAGVKIRKESESQSKITVLRAGACWGETCASWTKQQMRGMDRAGTARTPATTTASPSRPQTGHSSNHRIFTLQVRSRVSALTDMAVLLNGTAVEQEAKARLEQSQLKKERDAADRAARQEAREEEEQRRAATAEQERIQTEKDEIQRREAQVKASRKRYINLRWRAEMERTQAEAREFFHEERKDELLKLDKHRSVQIAIQQSAQQHADAVHDEECNRLVKGIRRLFHFFDFDRDHRMSAEDVFIRLKELGTPYDKAAVNCMFSELQDHVPLFEGRTEATKAWLATGHPRPDRGRGALLETARPIFFGDEESIEATRAAKHIAEASKLRAQHKLLAFRDVDLSRRSKAKAREAEESKLLQGLGDIGQLLGQFNVDLGEDVTRKLQSTADARGSPIPTPPPSPPSPLPHVPVTVAGLCPDSFFEVVVTCMEHSHAHNVTSTISQLPAPYPPPTTYYMPPLLVSIFEYFLRRLPCDLSITSYASLEDEMFSDDGYVTARDCFEIIIRHTGENSLSRKSTCARAVCLFLGATLLSASTFCPNNTFLALNLCILTSCRFEN